MNWTTGNIFQRNCNRNSSIFSQENEFENVVRKTADILSRTQCVKTDSLRRLSGGLYPGHWTQTLFQQKWSGQWFMENPLICLLAASECNVVHYTDIIMGAIASQITSPTIVYSTVYSNADQRKHQSSASLTFVWEIYREPVNSPHKWPVTRKMVDFLIGHYTYRIFPPAIDIIPTCWL